MSKSKNNAIQRVLAILLLLFVPLFFVKEYKSLIFRKRFISGIHSDIVIHNKKNHQKTFVVFIVSDDDSPFTERSLRSVFDQKYPSYRVAFIDTSSNSQNFRRAKKTARMLGIENDVAFFRSNSSKKLEDVYYHALKQCSDEEIVVHLEASDWFVNTHVLEKLNEIYKDPDVWLTYSEYLESTSAKKNERTYPLVQSKQKRSGLQAPWLISHLKTFYVGLVRQVDINSVNPQTKNVDTEEVIMKALMQLSKWHIRFIPEALYVHNEESVENHKHVKISGFFLEYFKGRNTPIPPHFSPPKKMKAK